MRLKQSLKNILGDNYYKFRLNFLLKKFLGNRFYNFKKKLDKLKNKFGFIKIKLDTKIEHQKIVNKESGFIIDLTKDNYLSFHLRPKKSKNFYLESTCTVNEKIAIIIQGPILEKFEFLKETLKIYEKIFKNSIFIISTWENENQNLINSLNGEKTFIIFNTEPKKSIHNIDHQTISTYSGLKLALDKGAKYSIKTRSDIRLNKNNLESYLLSLVKTFPIKDNNLIKSRIIVPSLVTFKFRLYSLSDIVMFGNTNDLLIYFDNDSYENGLKKFGLDNKNILINETPLIPEVFLCSRFLNKLEGNVLWNLESWWKSLKDYFCIIDNSSLDLFWFKYHWDYEYRYLRTYSNKFARAIDFQDWLSLYNNFENNWKLISREHEKYNKQVKLVNFFNNQN